MTTPSPLKEQFDAVLGFAAPLEAANKRKERRSKGKNAEKDDKPEDGADFLHQVLVQATKTPEFSEKIVEAVDLHFEQSAIITPVLRDTTTVAADAIRVFRRGGAAALAVIFEVQMNVEPEKYGSWIQYICRTMGEAKCPAMLLVVCVEKKVEVWARRLLGKLPFKSPGLVLGIDQLEKWVPDSREIRAVLKAVAYLKSDGSQDFRPIVKELALAGQHDAWRPLCYALIPKVLKRADPTEEFTMEMFKDPDPEMVALARGVLGREIEQSKAEGVKLGKAEGVEIGKAEGEAKGLEIGKAGARTALLQILGDRGITLSATQHAKLEAANLDTVLGWLRQAASLRDGETQFELPN